MRELVSLRNESFDKGTALALPQRFKHLAKINTVRDFVKLANETTSGTITEDIPVVVSQIIAKTAVARRTARKVFASNQELVNAPGSSIRIPGLNTVTYSSQTEGAVSITRSALDTNSGVAAVTVTPTLFMGASDITMNTFEDGKHDWMQLAGERHGTDAAVEEDRFVYGSVYAGLTGAHTEDKTANGWDASSGFAGNIEDDILAMIDLVEVDKFAVDRLLLNTATSQYIRKHPNYQEFSAYGGGPMHTIPATELRDAGIRGVLYGAEVVISPNVFESTSFANTDSVMAVDSRNVALIVDKRPYTLKSKDFPELDEVTIVGSYRMGVGVIQPNAGAGKTDVLSPS